MIDETQGPGEQNAAPEGQNEAAERVAFCQNCGKPLTRETIRRAGSAIYCEPCLVARLEGAPPAGGPAAPGWTPVNGPAAPAPGAPTANEPSPWLAAFLGCIPGVGAAYNGQYAKGLAHLVVFVVLDSLSNHGNDVFSLLVVAFVVYQIVDAYHTAKARRDGTPLPNAFGLNDIGDRMGFGRNWPGSASRPVTSSTTAGWASAAAAPGGTVPPSPGPTAPPNWAGYVPPTNYGATAPPPPPPASAYAGQPSASSTAWSQPPYTPPDPAAPWQATPTSTPIPAMPTRRFPIGAAWLIAVGLVLLVANLNASWRLGGSWLAALCLAALGSFLLFRRIELVRAWSKAAADTHPDAPSLTPWLTCQIRGPVMLLVLALLFALQAAGIRTLGQTWGVLLIAFGALLILERTVGRTPSYPPFPGNPPPANPPAPEPRKDGR